MYPLFSRLIALGMFPCLLLLRWLPVRRLLTCAVKDFHPSPGFRKLWPYLVVTTPVVWHAIALASSGGVGPDLRAERSLTQSLAHRCPIATAPSGTRQQTRLAQGVPRTPRAGRQHLQARTRLRAGTTALGSRWGWACPAGQGLGGSVMGDVWGLLEKAPLTGGSTVHFFERRSNVGDILANDSGCTLFYTITCSRVTRCASTRGP